MTQSQPPITGTIHTLPFDKLSPRDFERLCLWLVQREGYERAEHLGAAGREQGRDIVAWRGGALWAFQCKRVQNFYPRDALTEVEKVLALPEGQRPAVLVFLVTCDVAANTRQQAHRRCKQAGLECHFWAGTELDEKVNRHPDIVEEFFGSPIRKVFQAVVSPWGLTILAVGLILAFVLAAGIFNIPTLQGLLPTPTAFEPASKGQSLIIVADFDDRSGGKYQGVDPAQYIYEQLVAQAQVDGLDVRIERLRQVVDDNTARLAGEAYNATLVLWGWYDALTITPRMERIKTRSEYRSTQEGQHLSLADPEKIEFSIITDLPSQVAYLTLFTLGAEKLTDRDNDGALAYLDGALATILVDVETSINPSEAYLLRGLVYMLKDEHSRAIADLDLAIRLDPDKAEAYIDRGMIYFMQSDHGPAMDDLNQAIQLKPDLFAAYIDRGMIYFVQGDYGPAMDDLNQAIQLKPDLFAAYIDRGMIYFVQGDYGPAMDDLNQAIQLEPDFSAAYLDRGVIYLFRSVAYFSTGDYEHAMAELDKAITDLSQCIQSQTDFATRLNHEDKYLTANSVHHLVFDLAYLDRGIAYILRGTIHLVMTDYDRATTDFEQAVTDLDQAIQLQPDFFQAYLVRGIAYSSRASAYMDGYDRVTTDFEQALADFDQAIQLQPYFAPTYLLRGLTYFERASNYFTLGDYSRAIAKLDRAIADFNQVAQLQSNFDQILQLQPNSDQPMLFQFNSALLLRLYPNFDLTTQCHSLSATAYYNRGLSYYYMGNYGDAITDYDQAIQLQPDNVDVYYARGLAYTLNGENKKAIADFTEAIRIKPDYAVAYCERASLYSNLGDHEAARADIRRCYELIRDSQ